MLLAGSPIEALILVPSLPCASRSGIHAHTLHVPGLNKLYCQCAATEKMRVRAALQRFFENIWFLAMQQVRVGTRPPTHSHLHEHADRNGSREVEPADTIVPIHCRRGRRTFPLSPPPRCQRLPGATPSDRCSSRAAILYDKTCAPSCR